MGAPLNGQLDALYRDEIDSRYRVSSVSDLNTGFTFDGMRRYVRSTKEYYILKGDIWELVGGDTYSPDPIPIAYIHRGSNIVSVITPNEFNNILAGDKVYFNTYFSLPALVLVNNVTYYTNNIPVSIGLITDNGQSIKCKVLGGIPSNNQSRRFISITGSTSIVTIEADTYYKVVGQSVSVTVSNGAILYHKGTVSGAGGSDTVISVTGNSKYYHKGNTEFYGSFGLVATDNSYVEMRETSPTTFNFRPAIQLKNNAVCDYYGGIIREYSSNSLEGINAILTGSSILNLKEGEYTNNFGNSVVRLDNSSSLYISTLVSLTSSTDTIVNNSSNPIYKRYGSSIVGGISGESLNIPADKFLPFIAIEENQYGEHPLFYNQDDLNAYILGNTQQTAPQETLVINSVIAS